MTPDSMAFASGAGMAATARPSGRNRPAITISTAQTMKAPTAAENPPSTAPAVARSEPPGVDQAIDTGNRVQALSALAHTPIDTASALRPEAATEPPTPTPVSPLNSETQHTAQHHNAARQHKK